MHEGFGTEITLRTTMPGGEGAHCVQLSSSRHKGQMERVIFFEEFCPCRKPGGHPGATVAFEPVAIRKRVVDQDEASSDWAWETQVKASTRELREQDISSERDAASTAATDQMKWSWNGCHMMCEAKD
ncbi:hypothetical protein PAPYR_10524 [Paratrimastix pyriformis]|uniref:Uncharacterized protein n=1 Tax=Paratrimastix pyriformis TaxID=342808 RepID=A0ABQ8U5S6_9EUKA|nr:hypothetical protein PAPYR_10524 [Paratrimastix pyriformis]